MYFNIPWQNDCVAVFTFVKRFPSGFQKYVYYPCVFASICSVSRVWKAANKRSATIPPRWPMTPHRTRKAMGVQSLQWYAFSAFALYEFSMLAVCIVSNYLHAHLPGGSESEWISRLFLNDFRVAYRVIPYKACNALYLRTRYWWVLMALCFYRSFSLRQPISAMDTASLGWLHCYNSLSVENSTFPSNYGNSVSTTFDMVNVRALKVNLRLYQRVTIVVCLSWCNKLFYVSSPCGFLVYLERLGIRFFIFCFSSKKVGNPKVTCVRGAKRKEKMSLKK